jgi:PKD domain-containing protein
LADSIYWTNASDNTIRVAPLGGTGPVNTLYDSAQGVNLALGMAIDPAAGRIYWANYGDSKIRRAPLAGGGTPDTLYDSAQGVNAPVGVAIHPAAGRIYWTQNGDSTIRDAPLAGGGAPNTLYSPAQAVFNPAGMAIDPAANRIYWINGDSTIRGAPLGGAGPVNTLYGLAQGTGGSTVAIDPAAGRIYWTGYSVGTIRVAPLAGGGAADTLYDSAKGVKYPAGVAIDPTPEPALAQLEVGGGGRFAAFARWIRNLLPGPSSPPGRIYLSNSGDNTVRGAPLAGGGTLDTLYGSAQGVAVPTALAVLRAPLGAGTPVIAWSLILDLGNPFAGLGFSHAHSGPLDQQLSCSRGTWAADVPGSFLYRAPQSFAYQWRLGGTDIGGATASKYTPTAPGSYTCRVTATNQAGSATQTSAAVTIS